MNIDLSLLESKIEQLLIKINELESEKNTYNFNKEKQWEAEEKFNILSRFTEDSIIITGSEGKIIEWNKAAEELIGFSKNDAIGVTLENLILSPFERKKYENFYLTTIQKGKEESGNNFLETYVVKKNGDEISVKIYLAFINSYPEKYSFHLIRLNKDFDIEEHPAKIKLDIILQNEIKELEKRAQTLLDEHERLNKSETELKKINHDKDKFFSIIAHDLRSPFQSLLNSANTLNTELEDLEKDEIKIFISNISNSAKHVYRLVENLLDWSRIQTGAIEIIPKAFNIKDLIMEAAYIYKNMAIEKKISFKLESQKGVDVYADENMISTVLRNLVANALKFTKTNGTVTIRAEKEDGFARISVEDTGVGIDEMNLNKLFRIDSHFTTAGTAKEKGTGLGLILCKEFIETNGGKIWVESELGKGSKFIFILPLNKEES